MANDDQVKVKFGATTEDLTAGINNVKDQIESLTDPISAIQSAFAAVTEVIATAFAVDKIQEFISRFAELGEKISRTAAITGVSTDNVQLFSLAIKMAGGDADTAGLTLNILQKNIGAAISQAGPARTAFENMGFSLEQLKKTDVVTLLFEIKQRMDEAGTSAEQAALKQEYLRAVAGRSAAAFLALNLSLEQVKKLAAETGSTMSPAMVGQAKELADKSHELGAAWEGLSNTVGSKITPAYEGFIGVMTRLIEKTNELISANDHLSATDKPYDPGGLLKNYEDTPQTSIAGASQGMLVGATAGQITPPQNNPLPTLNTGTGEDTDDEQSQQELKLLQQQIDGYKLDEEAKKLADEAKVASGQMSNQQMTADLSLNMQQQEDQIQALFTQQMSLYDEDDERYTELNIKKLEIAVQYSEKILQAQVQAANKAAEETKKTWEGILNTIDGTLDKMLSGVLMGTQSMSMAFRKMAGDMALSFIEAIAKMMVKWTAFEAVSHIAPGSGAATALSGMVPNALGGTGGGLLGGASKDAAETANTTALGVLNTNIAALNAALGIQTPAITTTAANLAANTASNAAATAGTAANTAATSGSWLATIANTVSTDANTIATDLLKMAMMIKGAITSLLSLDVGSWNLPSDTIAQVHAGEMIIPAAQAAQIRSGAASVGGSGAGGNSNITFNVSAIDAAGVSQFFSSNGGMIAKAVASQLRLGNSSLKGAMT